MKDYAGRDLMWIGGNRGELLLYDPATSIYSTIRLDGSTGNVDIGGYEKDGALRQECYGRYKRSALNTFRWRSRKIIYP